MFVDGGAGGHRRKGCAGFGQLLREPPFHRCVFGVVREVRPLVRVRPVVVQFLAAVLVANVACIWRQSQALARRCYDSQSYRLETDTFVGSQLKHMFEATYWRSAFDLSQHGTVWRRGGAGGELLLLELLVLLLLELRLLLQAGGGRLDVDG